MAIDLCYRVGVDATNPYNPFGFSLDGNSPDFGLGRRPVEGGPRIFRQNVDTKYYATGLNGDFELRRSPVVLGRQLRRQLATRASQTVTGTYNIRAHHECAGSDRPVHGAVRSAESVRRSRHDHAGNAELHPVHRERPQQAEARHVDGEHLRQSVPAAGRFARCRGRLRASRSERVRTRPIRSSPPAIRTACRRARPAAATTSTSSTSSSTRRSSPTWRSPSTSICRVATRYSDYSNFGSTTNNKVGFRWQIVDDFTFRGTWAEGFRAPSIGELFGTFSRFDATLQDPCSGNVTRELRSARRAAGLHAEQSADLDHHRRQPEPAAGNIEEPDARRGLQPGWAENTGWSQRMRFRAELLPPQDQRRDPGARCADAARPLRRDARSGVLQRHHARGERLDQRLQQHAAQSRQDQHQGLRLRHQLARQRDRLSARSARICRRRTRRATKPSRPTPAQPSRARSASKSPTARFRAGVRR